MYKGTEGIHDKNLLQAKQHSSLKEIGELLRKARQEQNISPEDFANALRLGEGQLHALENGEVGNLPEPVFIKGMIRRIAEKLNLNSEEIIEHLKLID